MTFGNDSEMASFVSIGQIVREVLTSDEPQRADCLIRISQAYDRIGRKAAVVA